jgi:fumarate reductase subunit D
MLRWSEQPLVKFAEFGLVFLLAVHFFGGLRLLALEFLPWQPQQKTFAAIVAALAFFVALGFLLRAI